MSTDAIQPRRISALVRRVLFRPEGVADMAMNSAFTRMSTMAMGLAAQVLYARMLGPEGRGELAALLYWGGLLTTVLLFGFDAAAIDFGSRAPARVRGTAFRLILFSLAAGLVAAGAVAMMAGLTPDRPAPPAVWIAPWVTLTTLVLLYNNLLAGIGRMNLANAMSMTGSALILAALAGIYFIGGNALARIATMLIAVQAIVVLLLLTTIMRRGRAAAESPPYGWNRWRSFSLRSYAASLSMGLIIYGMPAWLAVTLTSREIGLFSSAQVLSDVLLVLPSIVGAAVYRVLATRPPAEAAALAGRIFRLAWPAALLLWIALSVSAPLLVRTAFGAAFTDAARLMPWLAMSGALTLPLTILAVYLTSQGHPGIPALAGWTGVAVAVLVAWALPADGGLGVAVAMIAHRATSIAGLYWFARRKLLASERLLALPARSDVDALRAALLRSR